MKGADAKKYGPVRGGHKEIRPNERRTKRKQAQSEGRTQRIRPIRGGQKEIRPIQKRCAAHVCPLFSSTVNP